ncbi:MAG TPA: S4 domain-containing protein, partial [Paludibacteraceae bacterium]|nr:S4 domain-containing protein [Paludibacteraceae bacterium]
LDPKLTSPYKFYQFWLNVGDEDAAKYIKIFTTIEKEECENLIAEHTKTPHLRLLQKRLAKDVTIMVHSEEDYNAAVEASNILFGNATADILHKIDEETLLAVFEGVPQFEILKSELDTGIRPLDLLAEKTEIFPSKGEARKTILAGGVSINKEKVTDMETPIDTKALLNNRYILVQKGKKNYFLIVVK